MPAYVLDNTLGSALVGLVVAAILYGVSVVQAWYYYTHHGKDSWLIKLLVGAVMIFDTTHQVLITHVVYAYTVTNWGNPPMLQLLVWSLTAENIFNGLTALLVQSFLTKRVWRLSHGNKLLTGVIMLLVVAEFVALVVFVVLEFPMKTYADLVALKYLSIAVNVLAAAGDILIAAALCSLLYLSRTGLKRTDTMIHKLMLFAVNTGLLTSFCALGSLITILVAGHTWLYIAFFFCLGRLYTNSLLATLNARNMIRSLGSVGDSTGISLSLGDFPTTRRTTNNISIKVDTTQEFEADNKVNTISDLEKAPTASSSTQDLQRKETESV